MALSIPIQPKSAKPGSASRLILVVWMFLVIVLMVLLFAYFSISLLSSVRAYVGAEGLWSKGQKDAVFALSRYSQSLDPADFETFQVALSVNQGDHLARIELEKPQPDLSVAVAGFIQARNHPDDVQGMIFIFRYLRFIPEIDKAIYIWAQADQYIEALRQLGQRINVAVQEGVLTPQSVQQYQHEVYQLNNYLTPLENDFSYTLGEASRKAKALLLLTMFAVVSVLLPAAFFFSRRVLRQNAAVQFSLQQGERQLRHLIEFAPVPILIVRSADEAVVYANAHALAQFKIDWPTLSQTPARNFYVNAEDRDRLNAAFGGHGNVHDLELQLRDARGGDFWVLYSSQRISYEGHDCILTALNNIDGRKRAHDELQHRAFHDELTDLPNRAMFMDVLKRTLSRFKRSSGVFSILFIDLDRFKAVNDELGHEIGDLLLKQVAQRIRASVRESDLVARLGGDEFVVLIEDLANSTEVWRIAQNIRDALGGDYLLNGCTVTISSSIGISSFPADGEELSVLLNTADLAMYKAKGDGRNLIQ
jgi:diguanylate cyclase (GGDEF)-like protein